MVFDTRRAISIAGASSNEENLFAFGDIDGIGHEAKLKHPLSVHYSNTDSLLYITDTLNHKVKILTSSNNAVSTYAGQN